MTKTLSKGFTLIELLVVIAIIGILAAVVLIAINPAERIAEANDSKTKSNIGQVATAVESCYTANAGSYAAACLSAQAVAGADNDLMDGGYLKQAMPTIGNAGGVEIGNAGGNAAVFGAMTAKSNSTAALPCAAGQYSFMTYHTTTGATDTKGGACTATKPTS